MTAQPPLRAGEVHEEITRQLVTLFRSAGHLHQTVALPDGVPALERPAFLLLMRLAERGPVRASTIADCLYLDLSTVSRQLTGLESADWVAREPDPEDRRASLVRLTDAGLSVLRRNKAARQAAIRDMLSDWPQADLADFARLLTRMNDSMAARRTGPATPCAVPAPDPAGDPA